jgi:hypothetical protein
MTETQEQLIYPEGRMQVPERFLPDAVKDAIDEIAVLPRILDLCVENLDAAQLVIPYREGGWNIHQIIHHIADSHMNAFVRCKLVLTEDNPVIKPYLQESWAQTPDVSDVPVNYSVTLVHALHHRFAVLLRSLGAEELHRTYYHPEYKKNIAVWEMVHMYAWHGRHHTAQIRQFRLRNNWL